MASYNPPSENLPIFNSQVFKTGEVSLTQAQADKRYLRFPNAQGEENLQVINVNGIATFNDEVVVNNEITYIDNTSQTSAYTGAGALSGTYTTADITINTDGKITAISNGSGSIPLNATFNSLSIAANPNPGGYSTAGLNNQYNRNGFFSKYSGTVSAYNSNWTPSTPVNILFRNNSGTGAPTFNGMITLRVNCFFYNTTGGTGYGYTSCDIVLFPSAIKTTWGSYGNTTYNINNYINGNNSFNYTDATYAPYGRQYFTYNQQFAGGVNAQAYLRNTLSTGQSLLNIYFQFPYIAFYSMDVHLLSTNIANSNNVGVEVYF